MSGRPIASLLLALSVVACSGQAAPGAGASSTRGPQNGPMDVHRSMAGSSPGASAPASSGAPANGDTTEASERGIGPKGPPAVVVPDVEGLVFASAVHRLWRAGIGVQLVLARSSRRPLYDVIEQDPQAGDLTPAAGVVNLILSLHRLGGAGVLGTVACKPEMDELRDPYCLGKLLKY